MKRGAGTGVQIDSAGTHDFQTSAAPHPSAIEAARKRGFDISGCKARRITAADFDHFDMILAMDKSNLEELRRIAPTRCKQKIELLLEYGDRFYGEEVPDPIGGDARLFDLAFLMIEDGCRGLAQLLLRAA